MNTTPKWAKKRVESGAVIEETIYLEGHAPGLVKGNTRSADEKRSENRNRRIRDLTRLINANFAAGDGFIRLSYSAQAYARLREGLPPKTKASPYVYTRAQETIKRFLRQCEYRCAKMGIPLRYVYITSNIKGATGHYARIHHHLIVDWEAITLVRTLWTAGKTHVAPLEDRPDYRPLAAYMLQQVPFVPGKRNYSHSNDLEKPIQHTRYLTDPNEPLHAPTGAQILRSYPNYLSYTYPNPTSDAD